MSKLRDKLNAINSQVDEYNKKHNIVNYDNLNSRDSDENVLADPSLNDYLKGYNINPYEFQQWAKKKLKGMDKTAAEEADVMHFTPEYLADKILMLWNGADGPLQNFFDAFTLRYPNKLTKDVASMLNTMGYKVFPELVDDRPLYAKYKKQFKKLTASKKHNDAIKCLASLKTMNPFKKSAAFNKFYSEIEKLSKSGLTITAEDMSGLLNYYEQIFPEDFAVTLTTNFIKKDEKQQKKDLYDIDPNKKMKHFNDTQLSNESLDKIEDYMSGNAQPYGQNYNQGGYPGGYFGYDTTTQMYSDQSVPPTSYEVRSSIKKKGKK